MTSYFSFINPRAQPYETLKNSLDLGPSAARKFDILNVHVRNIVVMPGELIIVGDSSTTSCSSEEAFLMNKAREVQIALLAHGGGNGFIVDNYQMISTSLGYSALGIGTATGAWAKRLTDIQKTLTDIEVLYQQSLGKNSILSRNEFITRRRSMFGVLDRQLKGFAGLGSGLKNTSGIRNMLGLSTNSYLRHAEISGYAERIGKVAKAARFMKAGGYVGIGLELAASGVNIYQACAMGREEECKKAKYLEGGKLVAGVGGGIAIARLGSALAYSACAGLGVATGGVGMFACLLLGSAVGGYVGGLSGSYFGEVTGKILYSATES